MLLVRVYDFSVCGAMVMNVRMHLLGDPTLNPLTQTLTQNNANPRSTALNHKALHSTARRDPRCYITEDKRQEENAANCWIHSNLIMHAGVHCTD